MTERAFAAHRAQVADVLATGDPAAIKRLYAELGDLLEAEVARGEQPPVLSLPETAPVVASLLEGIEGVVLDAGCGPNPVLSVALGRRPGCTVVAADIGLGMVRLARGVAAAHGTEVLPVVADLEALPFRAGAFAGGVCDDTIEHVPDDARAARELARVVAPGGRLVLATPNRFSLEVLGRKAVDQVRGRRRPRHAYYAASSHLREYTWGELDRVVSPWLRVRRRASVGWSGGRVAGLATALTGRPPLRRLSRMIVLALEPR